LLQFLRANVQKSTNVSIWQACFVHAM
jgi:hypothetical protein